MPDASAFPTDYLSGHPSPGRAPSSGRESQLPSAAGTLGRGPLRVYPDDRCSGLVVHNLYEAPVGPRGEPATLDGSLVTSPALCYRLRRVREFLEDEDSTSGLFEEFIRGLMEERSHSMRFSTMIAPEDGSLVAQVLVDVTLDRLTFQ